ncbi:hypothetical protein KIW84_066329 [Lathyrus oleraceus]|uniref:Integrase catalytic domain-containing protein n=1 Tax=Pisum sativum TaxID=3888 RepID=A0A9D4WGN0_PEA|nr:hypothetical protein KIW84_066329 [Pisum sativum]
MDRPAYVFAVDTASDDEKPWYYDIKRYLETQEYPEGASKKDRKTLRRLAMVFYLNKDGVLYKRNFDWVLLRCVDDREASQLMKEVHEGSFGTHASGNAMIYADKVHVPPNPLSLMSSPWPFSMWGIDMIGKIEPTASNEHRFILVAIDYFTKWVEAASYTNVTKQVVSRTVPGIQD